MSEQHDERDKEVYDLHGEPEEASPREPVPPREPAPPRGGGTEPSKPAPRSVREHVCPNCGAPLPGRDSLLCLRCGYDLRTLRIVKTHAGKPVEAVEEEEPDEPAQREPLSAPGRGDLWLPGAIAVAAALIIVVGYFSGARGLFPGVELHTAEESGEQYIRFPDRMLGLLRFAVRAILLSGCGTLALWIGSLLWTRPLGDLRLGIVRITGAVLAMLLVGFIALTKPTAEWMIETVLAAAIFVGLSSFFFRLGARDAATFALVALMSLGALWAVGHLVTWVV